jgi:transaldolase
MLSTTDTTASEVGALSRGGARVTPSSVKRFANKSPNVSFEIGEKVGIDTVVKIPLTADGIYLAPKIKALGGKILMTACYSAHQMIIAQSLCADYIAPYVGRMDDAGADIHAELRTIHSLSHSGPCRPLLASLRSVSQMTQMAALGHDCFTIAPAIADQLKHDPLTEQAAQEFEAAAKNRRLT